jgi:hypothetical protein
VAFHLNEIRMRRIESATLLRNTASCVSPVKQLPVKAARSSRKPNKFMSDEDEEEDGDDNDEEEVLTAPIRTETYVGDDEDLEFVAPDDEEESDSENVSDVNILNILPSGSRRIARKTSFYMMVPTPDDDRLLVDVGESATDEDEESSDDDDVCAEESLEESSGDDDYHLPGCQSRRVWLLHAIMPISAANEVAMEAHCPESREACIDELDTDYSPPAGYEDCVASEDEGDLSSSDYDDEFDRES